MLLRRYLRQCRTIGINRVAHLHSRVSRRSYAVVASSLQEKNSNAAFDEEIDVLIVGSGGAGLAAALRCNALSLSSLVVEKTDKIGGTTALSGGGMWIPNNLYSKARGDNDSIENALTYMNHCIGNVGLASSPERRIAFLENAPRMLEFLKEQGYQGCASGQYPNYYPQLPGGEVPRCVEDVVFDARKIGSWFNLVRQGPLMPPVYTDEVGRPFKSATLLSNMIYAATIVKAGDMGDAIQVGGGVDAQLALMDDAWWGPSVIDPVTGQRFFLLFERGLPHSIIVDSSGKRFMNEAESYTDAGQAMYRRNRDVAAIPAWIILDSNHRKRYLFTTMPPRFIPKSALKSGFIVKSNTLEDLANQIGVNPQDLNDTVQRFGDMARRGIDDDFGRGGNVYDQFFADPKVKPNGSLGPIEKAPFYAVKVWPGDLGTKGGLLKDENAQVVGKSSKPIPGLYAAGNTTASVMGRCYPGPGSTLGPALTFSFIAVNHMAKNNI
ncbi:FAD binding domain-containing protein [Fusarium mundagurra]|uniref:FAD binding domain-containing protein n=1 Tax=Fusarium mundagurra TaxID=1567541 RepID=A0A8H5YMH2_9HYPO|nr:FAD binding domain-containing protein [Fusarium mundagurra]